MSELDKIDAEIDHNGMLLCPCGGCYLHQQHRISFEDWDDAAVPLGARVVMSFVCEDCELVRELEFIQHEGNTLVRWLNGANDKKVPLWGE